MSSKSDQETSGFGFHMSKIWTKLNIFQKLSRITVEPLLFMNVLALGAMFVTCQSFVIHSICTRRNSMLNLTGINCDNLQAFPDEEEAVQVEAVEYLTFRRMLETSIILFYSMFLGDWVQKHGSKSMMVLPLIGFVLSAAYMYILAHFPEAHTGLVLLASIPTGLGGANFALILSTSNYVTHNTSVENRSFRLAMAEGSAILGFPVGLWIGEGMVKATGFTGVFLLCTILQCVALLYTIFFVKNDGISSTLSLNMFKGLCNLDSIKRTARLCTKRREGSKQMWLFLIFIIWSLRVLAFSGMENVFFLYARLKFGWSSFDYTHFAMTETLLAVAGIIVLSFVGIQILKLKDAVIGVMATLCSLSAALVFAFASAGWMAYLALGFQMFGAMLSIVVRSLLSKLVSPEEVPIAFVWNGIIENVAPLVAAPLYGFVYSNTLETLPNAVFFVTVGLSTVGLTVLAYLAFVTPVEEHPHETLNNSVSLSISMGSLSESKPDESNFNVVSLKE